MKSIVFFFFIVEFILSIAYLYVVSVGHCKENSVERSLGTNFSSSIVVMLMILSKVF